MTVAAKTPGSWPPTLLRSDRMVLRPPDFDDGPALHAVLNDPEVVRFLPYGPSGTLATTQHMIALWVDAAARGVVTYALAPLAHRDQPFGLLQVQHQPNTDEAELGVVLDPAHWGQGYAREAFRAIRLSTPAGGMMRLYGAVDAANSRALSMLGKIGLADPEPRSAHRVHPSLSAEPRACLLFEAHVTEGQLCPTRPGD